MDTDIRDTNLINKRWQTDHILLIAFISLSVGFAQAEESPWITELETTLAYDNNISQAERARDIIADQQLLINAGLVNLTRPAFGRSLSYRLGAEFEAWRYVPELNRTSVSISSAYRWQNNFGFSSPFYRLSGKLTLDDYASAGRDSTRADINLTRSRRITDRVTHTLGIELRLRDSDGTVWDTQNQRIFVNRDYLLNDRYAGYGTYSLMAGDTLSSAQNVFCNGLPANDIFELVQASDAVEPDPAFSEQFCSDWLAYRLPGTTHSLTVGLNRNFGHQMALDFSTTAVYVAAKGDNHYSRWITRLSWLAVF